MAPRGKKNSRAFRDPLHSKSLSAASAAGLLIKKTFYSTPHEETPRRRERAKITAFRQRREDNAFDYSLHRTQVETKPARACSGVVALCRRWYGLE